MNKEKKTVREWILGMPTLNVKLKALHNMKKSKPYTGNAAANSMREALLKAFDWEDSKEGLEYWSEECYKYRQTEPIYADYVPEKPKTVVINWDVVTAVIIITAVVALFFIIWLKA